MDSNDRTPQVRGVTSNFAPPSGLWRNLARLRNGFFAGSIALGLVSLAGWLPTFSVLATAGVVAVAAAWFVPQFRLSRSRELGALVLAAIAFPSALAVAVFTHAIWRGADTISMDGWTPPAEERNWEIAGFYYAIGFWPRAVGGQPVLPAIPYQKGPPSQFLGRVTLRWNWPEVRIQINGPKTPEPLADGRYTRDSLRECLARRAPTLLFSPACVSLRAEIWRKLELPAYGKARWFEVQQPKLPESERAQGLWVDDGLRTYAVLVNEAGALQSLALELLESRTPVQAEADREAFRQVVRSLRVTKDLAITRTIADHELETVTLQDIDKRANLEELAHVQRLLASKLSVNPEAGEAYFHLAGSAWVVTRSSFGALDLVTWAKVQIMAAQAYLRDVAPNSPRMAELDSLAAQAKSL